MQNILTIIINYPLKTCLAQYNTVSVENTARLSAAIVCVADFFLFVKAAWKCRPNKACGVKG